MLQLFNSLSRRSEEFRPLSRTSTTLYTCGPTVYGPAHLGNLRTYLFEDLLKRVLLLNGHRVIHAMNITDVGHLTGDGDQGEDKLERQARQEQKTPAAIAEFYTERFFDALRSLNILPPDKVLAASAAVPEAIEIIKRLEEKRFTYRGRQAIYFDTARLPGYGRFVPQKSEEKRVGARAGVVRDVDKKNPADFALWFFLAGRYQNHILRWPSPWGEGFPGWHIECSAISRKLLGQPFDIHAGGVDHLGTHHPNEMAQSEAAFDLPLARFWLHGEFLLVDGGRMGKSEGNLLTLADLGRRGFSPSTFRYLCLTAHYRRQLNFTWEALAAAAAALNRLRVFVRRVDDGFSAEDPSFPQNRHAEDFLAAVNDDLNGPAGLAVLWSMLGSDLAEPEKLATLFGFDRVLGLGLREFAAREQKISNPNLAAAKRLLAERDEARRHKDWRRADQLRQEIERLNFTIEDRPTGSALSARTREESGESEDSIG